MKQFAHGGDIYSHTVKYDFSSNINPLGMPEAVKSALISNIERFSLYPDPQCRSLRCAIAEKDYLPVESILCGAGAADLIIRICLALAPRRVAVCAPTFSEYENAALQSGSAIQYIPLKEENGFALTEDIFNTIATSPDILFLCTPNNPTGRIIPTTMLCKILEACAGAGTMLVLDECFLSFTREPSMRQLTVEYPNLIILDAFTKMYAVAGLRLGYMICSDIDLIRRIAETGQSWSVSVPAQIAGTAALTCKTVWEEQTRRFVENENRFIRDSLRKLDLKIFDGAANYTLFKSGLTDLKKRMLEHGILIRSCENYHGLTAHFYRVATRTHIENKALTAVLADILNKEE